MPHLDLLAFGGQRIRCAKLTAGLNQQDIDDAAAISQQQIAKIEAGGSNVTLWTLETLTWTRLIERKRVDMALR